MLHTLPSEIQLVTVFPINVSKNCFFVYLKAYKTHLLPVNELNVTDKDEGTDFTYFTPKSSVKMTPKKSSIDLSCSSLFSRCITAVLLVCWTDHNMNKRITGAFELSSSCAVDDIQAKIEGNRSKLVLTYMWPKRLLNGEKYNTPFTNLYQGLKRLK